MDLRLMLETFRAFMRGAPVGDVAVMKLAALRSTPPGFVESLRDVRAFAPKLTLQAMKQLPEGSLGRHYADHLESNGIEHLTISQPLLERFADNPYAIRYTVTHDLHHVLTGFDTGVAGEVGVAAFTAAQGAGPLGLRAMRGLRWLYALVSPGQARAIFHNTELGVTMGKKAKLVMAEPLESWLEVPIIEVRRRVGILDEDRASILPSGKSSLVRAIYEAAGRKPATTNPPPEQVDTGKS